MQTLARKFPSPLLWIKTTTMLLSRTAGFAALMAWMPFLVGASSDALSVSTVDSGNPDAKMDAAASLARGTARRKARCGECGSIESIRKTEGQGDPIPLIATGGPARSASHEITVRLEDGSSRVIVDANPARWRLGERVKVIDGVAGAGS